MEDMARAEYPAMLAALRPNEAVQTLNDRTKRINRINLEIADWLQERCRIEEQYSSGLRRLAQFRAPNAQSELGVFQVPWARLIESVEAIAMSHQQFSERIQRDVEHPLRVFQSRKEMTNMNSISSNLTAMAKALDDAQGQSEKVGKKGGKASAQKVDTASAKLESATQQWEAQAPFIFESFQSVDELRVNHLRDLLTQYQTHESDRAQRAQDGSTDALAVLLEVDSSKEIESFVNKATQGRATLPNRPSTRRSSGAGTPSTTNAPSMTESGGLVQSGAPVLAVDTDIPDVRPPSSVGQDPKTESPRPASALRRLGTMFGGRRRQSVHGGLSLSSAKSEKSGFGRLGRQERPGLSPRTSSNNLNANHPNTASNLGAVSESADLPRTPEYEEAPMRQPPPREDVNGVNDNLMDSPIPSSGMNGNAMGHATLPERPHTAQNHESAPPSKDAEGYSIPAPLNDPISEAQREAAGDEADQMFKLSIQNQPIAEEDPDAKIAALSSVANSLKMGPATRRTGTVRGRRDVRNTIYVPSPTSATGESAPDYSAVSPLGQISPAFASLNSKPSALAALASEASVAGTSDTTSIRSGTSLGSLAHAKHPDMLGPGLQSSIVETVSAVFEGGSIQSASISGEVAFVYNQTEATAHETHETIKINNFPSLERIGPNRIFVQNSSVDHPEQFSLDLSHLGRTSTAFSYRVFVPEGQTTALGQNAPLLLHPAWKPQGDKLGLLIQYQLNPASNLPGPVTLHNVVFVATYSGKASGAQTKPSGTHLKEKHLVYWRLGDLTLTSEAQKIVCRIVGQEGAEPQPGTIEARWEYSVPAEQTALGSGINISRLEETKGKGKEVDEDDPFADEDGIKADQAWVDVPLVKKLVSGRYEGR